MLCYRCGSHVPDGLAACGSCGQALAPTAVRHATGTFSRKKLKGLKLEGAPYAAGSLIAGRYLVKDTVGAGPHGFVFRAQDKEIDVEVAIKIVSPKLVQTPEERRAFSREIRLGRKLAHNHLVRVYEDGEDQDRPYFTMQFLDGLPLRRIVELRKEKGQFFSVREVEPIVAQIAQALDSAHKVGPHSDVRPDNVIILPDLLKLTDFGLGLAIPRHPFANALRASKGDVYLAPEYLAEGEVDGRADVYSLGVLVGEMLAGVLPDGSVPKLRSVNRDIPERAEALYQRAVNPNPLARFSRPSDLAAELSDLAKSVPPPRPSLPKRPPAPSEEVPPAPRASSQGEAAPEPKSRRAIPSPDSGATAAPASANGEAVESTTPMKQPVVPPPPPPEALEEAAPGGAPAASGEVPLPSATEKPTALRPVPRPVPRRSTRSTVWLVVLVVIGVGTGAGAGVFILDRINEQQQGLVAPAVGLPPGPATRARPPAAVEVATTPVAKPAPPAAAAPRPGADEKARKAEEERLSAERRRAEEEARVAKEAEAKRAADEAAKLAAEKRKAAEDEKRRMEDERRRAADEEKRRLAAKKAADADKGKEPKPEPEKGTAVAAVKPPPAEGSEATEPAAVKKGGGTCPAGMKLVPSGSFRMGSAKDDPMMGFDEKPLAATETDGFCVDYYEFPNAKGALPRVNVSYAQADQLCRGKGKRLCTEEEWERACKGPAGGARYPYGTSFDPDACNTRDAEDADRALAETGRFSRCRSGFGIADMSGNVAEWTGTRFGAEVTERAVKGGSYVRPDYDARCAARKPTSPDTREPTLGFRCCADPK